MHIKNVACGVLLMGVGGMSTALAVSSPPEISLKYTGSLVAEPCVIEPGDEEIRLDFGAIIDKYLYLNTRTQSKSFEIRLSECDLSIGKTVKVMFQGTESIELPGLLAVDRKGIAIGLETLEAKPLPINKESDEYPLHAGNSLIALKAYVQGEPRAITDKTIARGPFSAVATFSLEYE
ncbi:fimbrial protein [Serratia marcescens]|uniref:fimbrial protein n=1 Tax=Serratia TaxID=613 RepID=UPI003B9E79B4